MDRTAASIVVLNGAGEVIAEVRTGGVLAEMRLWQRPVWPAT
jgi:hypothetical protein